MKQFVIILSALFLFPRCSTHTDERRMIYYRPYTDSRVWIGRNEIDLTALKTSNLLSRLIFIAFDGKTRQLWALSSSADLKYNHFYNITGGAADINESISIERPERYSFPRKIYNNKILYGTEGRNLEFIDLFTRERTVFAVNDTDGRFPERLLDPLCFSDEIVLFRDGYYSLPEEKYYVFDNLRHPYLMANEKKIIGLNGGDYIVFYDLNTKSIENTNMRRKTSKGSMYNGEDLYFSENGKLFISKDIGGFKGLILMLLPPGYSNRKWYEYDAVKQKLQKIFRPHDIVHLLGEI